MFWIELWDRSLVHYNSFLSSPIICLRNYFGYIRSIVLSKRKISSLLRSRIESVLFVLSISDKTFASLFEMWLSVHIITCFSNHLRYLRKTTIPFETNTFNVLLTLNASQSITVLVLPISLPLCDLMPSDGHWTIV